MTVSTTSMDRIRNERTTMFKKNAHGANRLLFVAIAALVWAGCQSRSNDAEPSGDETEGSAEFEPYQAEGSADGPETETQPAELAAATVNGEIVLTATDLQVQLDDIVARYERLPDRDPTTARWRNQRRRRIVQQAVHDHIIDAHVAAQNIEIGDQQVESSILEDLGHVFEDERLFERFLQSHDQTREEYYAERSQELAVDAVLSQRGSLEPTDEELTEFYEQNRDRWREDDRALVSTITIRLRRDADEEREAEALEQINAIRDRVRGDEDFAEVARETSESADRVRGGDMGWIVRGRRQQLADDGVEDVLFSARIDSVTEPVRTSLGYQIFLVRDRRDAGIRDLDEVRDIIYEPLVRRRRDRLRRELVEELLADVEVTYAEENWGIEEEAPRTPTPTPAPTEEETGE